MKNFILTFLIFLLPVVKIFAQVPPPPDQGEDAGGPGAPSTPIDQYLFVLLMIVVVFAIYFVWNQRKLVRS